MLSACWWQEAAEPVLYPAAYDHLPGWRADRMYEVFAAFRASCAVLPRQKPWAYRWRVTGGDGLRVASEDLQAVCEDAGSVAPEDARAFFEASFTPFLLTRDGWPAGLITGYYAPVLQGSYRRTERFQWPLYKLPPELAGAPDPAKVPDRAAIDAGALAGRGLELLWVDDPVMRFFLHVQGSGFVEMTDGSRVQLRFAGKNGHPYVPLGRVMAERGLIPLEQVTMPAIRDWLRAHPEKQAELFAQNPSYVFFSLEKGAPPVVGAQGAELTGGRSLAVDSMLYPYGLPMFLTAAVPRGEVAQGALWQRLMVAQDTGSAIRGPVRADVYFGEGRPAEALAGHMNSQGSLVLLVPTLAVERRDAAP
jgi:membrane-bound lytic murein transglycosylase A